MEGRTMIKKLKSKFMTAKKKKDIPKDEVAPASRPALGVAPKPEIQSRKTTRKLQMF